MQTTQNKNKKEVEVSALVKLQKILAKGARKKAVYNYTIPDLWNVWGYNGDDAKTTRFNETIVNPYKFYNELIKSHILPKGKKNVDYSQSLSQISPSELLNKDGYLGGDWLKKATAYSTMVRSSTSWDHDRSGEIESLNLYDLKETGTFIKTIALLPLLKKMGVNVLYMLPISKFSERDKKGELGSPYAVNNFYELDPNLHDPIVGEELTLEEQFKALTEACHILGIRVIIDLIPRTNSVDSELIIKHPDWFYWIRQEEYEGYFPPSVPELGELKPATPENMAYAYRSGDVWNHIRKFTYAPNVLDETKWNKLVEKVNKNSELNILDLVKDEYGIVIAPAFSDNINDPQPPWSDVTFFRMYMDHPINAQKFHGDEQLPPYILFDTIKSNLNPGNEANEGLWQVLEGIIPYFQQNFGIDGARIDMGHALPSDLVKRILGKAREVDADFAFIAEELQPVNAKTARENGYNMIIGDGFSHVHQTYSRELHEYMYEVSNVATPVFAMAETHDTSRIAARHGRHYAKMIAVLNTFLPNGVPFINSGQEVYETQPMNLGLDCRENELYMLAPEDPYYAKLALFDKYAFHYTTYDRFDLVNTLEFVSKIRTEYIDSLIDLNNYTPLGFEHMGVNAVGFGYVVDHSKDHDNTLLIIANTDPHNITQTHVKLHELRHKAKNGSKNANQLYSTHYFCQAPEHFNEWGELYLELQPAEVKIIKL